MTNTPPMTDELLGRLRKIASSPSWPLTRNGRKPDEKEIWRSGGPGGRVAVADFPETADTIALVTGALGPLLDHIESWEAAYNRAVGEFTTLKADYDKLRAALDTADKTLHRITRNQ